MAYLGDVGNSSPDAKRAFDSFGLFGSQPLGNSASGTSATANAVIILMASFHTRVDATVADGSGGFDFYDLDDGIYYAVELGTNKSWEIEVVANTPTVTALSSGGAVTVAFGGVF